MYEKAKNYALYILSLSSQSKNNIIDKLNKKGFDSQIIDDVINFLIEYNFINDEDLSKHIVRDNSNLKRYGKNKIKINLYKKGISKELINKTISEEIDDDLELKNAIYLAEKKLSKIKETDKYKITQKIYSHLLYKGFDYDICKKAIEIVTNSTY